MKLASRHVEMFFSMVNTNTYPLNLNQPYRFKLALIELKNQTYQLNSKFFKKSVYVLAVGQNIRSALARDSFFKLTT